MACLPVCLHVRVQSPYVQACVSEHLVQIARFNIRPGSASVYQLPAHTATAVDDRPKPLFHTTLPRTHTDPYVPGELLITTNCAMAVNQLLGAHLAFAVWA